MVKSQEDDAVTGHHVIYDYPEEFNDSDGGGDGVEEADSNVYARVTKNTAISTGGGGGDNGVYEKSGVTNIKVVHESPSKHDNNRALNSGNEHLR